MGWDWTSWSWLPGPKSLSPPLKASPLWARGPLWGVLVGSSLALPCPCSSLSLCSEHFPPCPHYLLEGGAGCQPGPGQIPCRS